MTKLTHHAARQLIDAGIKAAEQVGVPMNIAVCDDGGLLVAFVRMDGSLKVSIDIAQKKARTAIMLNTATADLYALAQPGGELYGLEQFAGGLVVFGGGLPLVRMGETIGAIGVSGGSVDEDIQVAEGALAAFA